MSVRALSLGRVPLIDRTGWRGHLTALGIVASAILALFHADLWSMVTIWWTASTFGHCLFIPLLVAWLVQQRLPGLRQLEPVAWPPGLVWLALGALAWLVGAAAGVAMVRHGALVMMLQGVTIALLGPAVARALIFPLFYAFFMVPFGEEIVPPLQLVTARLAMFFLDLSGVPAHMEGIFITTPTGYFEVAEACSGAKFLIAMTAYGVLVCNVCFRTWPRRIIFMTGALGLSVLANGVRAFATILVAHLTSVDAAVGFDHVVYGWIFFAIIMIVVMATAWPFSIASRAIHGSIRRSCRGGPASDVGWHRGRHRPGADYRCAALVRRDRRHRRSAAFADRSAAGRWLDPHRFCPKLSLDTPLRRCGSSPHWPLSQWQGAGRGPDHHCLCPAG